MKNPKIFVPAFIVALLSCTSLYAEDQMMDQSMPQQSEPEQSTPQQAAQPQSVPMVTGGIGDAELSDINTLQKQYTVKLVFAEPSGSYLADVGVVILDHKKNVVVSADAQGPIVLIKLKPGTYTLTSSVTGDTKTQRIVVSDKSLHTYYVHLNSSES